MTRSFRRFAAVATTASVLLLATLLWFPSPRPAGAAAALTGSGSSFAGNELQQWSRDVGRSPYNLSVNWQNSSSGQGRQQFRDKVVDFAVSDIRYNKFDGDPPPAGTYIYVPVSAGGISVMYNLKSHGFGETDAPLQLSDYSLCGIFTGGIPYWDSDPIKTDNPGRTLPHVKVSPVMRSDPAGTNFVMEEYCIAKQRDLYFAFVDAATRNSGGQDFPKEPSSTWPIISPILGADGSDKAAETVAAGNNDGYVTAVETSYAKQRHFPVAAVKNHAGHYVLPTEPNVGAALSYATQLDDGTHNLNFDPPADNAYNPSTYSYLLARIKDCTANPGFCIDADKGASLTAFGNYALTIGQKGAGDIGYASIGLNLIEFGLAQLKRVPGHVDPTADETAAKPTTEQFNTKINQSAAAAAGDTATTSNNSSTTNTSTTSGNNSTTTAPGNATTTTTPGSTGTLGTGGGTGSSGGGTTGAGGLPSNNSAAGRGSTARGSSAPRAGSGGGSTSVGASGAGADPSVSLDPVASTGGEHQLLAVAGLSLVMLGEWGRTSARRRRRKPA